MSCNPVISSFVCPLSSSGVPSHNLFWDERCAECGLSITGQGEVLLNGLGGLYPVTIDGEYLVNLAYLVAFENSLKYEITQLSKKAIGSWFKKQPLFMKFTGQGKLYCQTHHAKTWGHLIASRLKSKL
ncbi:AIM24 family protein [Crocosphaera sp. UHCC 0190]|uniref:AIM24 family protein n=1 Tax=Crocosphaera sp. UHCC 0190 TaxID=3110246 RepID=UPI002B20AC1B|nr:AIM24 family protein [Crocosphaera sp. UHCC 0190]MEA5511524.1 AIM24 family protein [Crocosphaera sp. UHCC 0190]